VAFPKRLRLFHGGAKNSSSKDGWRGAYPTDPERERALGRIPVWLDVNEVRWLADGCCCGRDSDVSDPTPHTWECRVIRFRTNAALHKEGLKGSPGDEPT
jgi:hypothetical protein